MKRKLIIFLFISFLFFISLNAQTNVSSLLDLYEVRDNLSGTYNQTANIDLSPTNPLNVNTWSSGTSYAVGDYVKYEDDGTIFTYICIQATSSENPTNTSCWKQLWESDKGWKPIGFDSDNTGSPQFEGNYDGQGYTISNLFINRPAQQNVGLFSHLGYDGDGVEILDVGLLDVDIKGARGTGSLVGRVTGEESTLIELCYARNGTVVGDGATGGLVGSNNSWKDKGSAATHQPIISKCYTHIDVSWSRATGSGADKIGGLVGCNQKGRTRYSYSLGSVTVDNDLQVGTIVPERIGGLAGCTIYVGKIIN